MRGGVPPEGQQGGADPWAAFGYLVSGVGVYGLLGWGLSVWLDASWPIPVGILVGAVLGLLLVYYQLVRITGPSTTEGKIDSRQSEPDDPDDGPTERGDTE
jgi:F0F1-type ATP synthase assembly protein I